MAPKRVHEDSDVEHSSEEGSGSEGEWSEEIDTPAPGGCDIPTGDFGCSQNTLDWIHAAAQHNQLFALEVCKHDLVQIQAENERKAIESEMWKLKAKNLATLMELERLGAEGATEALLAEYEAALPELESMRKELGESVGKGVGMMKGGERK